MAYPPGMTRDDLIRVGEIPDPKEPPDCEHELVCFDCERDDKASHASCAAKGEDLICTKCEYKFVGMFYELPIL